MIRLVLVRHGEAAAMWSEATDPGLSPLGHEQARALAAAIDREAPRDIVTSPLLRARETARPLEDLWNRDAVVVPGVAEVPSSHVKAGDRQDWLHWFLTSLWTDLDDGLRAWRRGVIDALHAMPADAVVFTHFVAINVAVGVATGDDRVRCFKPDNCSRTVIDVDAGGLKLVSRGDEAATKVT